VANCIHSVINGHAVHPKQPTNQYGASNTSKDMKET
jgi:hypothetical protein